MVRNLLVNALRYAEAGTILLGCRRRDGHALIEVWDTGPGIPADQLKLIFDDFYRCGTDQRDSGRGLGLGLSIVRRTAQILGHQVDVRSRVGKGTVFSISVVMVGDRHNPLPEEPTTSVASA
nr:sensor histidine kinase [Azospirillum brasilense]